MSKEIFYIPNLLSIFRIILIIPVGYLLIYRFEKSNTIVIFLLFLMYVTDLSDGYIARRLNQVTDIGKIIDPLADKISVVIIALIIYFKGLIPTWFILIVILRDLLILSFGIYLKNKKKITLMSNYPGKLAVFSIGLILLFAIINSELLSEINSFLYYISTTLILFSSYLYLIRFFKIIGEKNHGK
ncbi:MAG: CDP-alcohol phosphatidyltransferase family protein [Ignavibacteria bacterium]|nr:CDP-alcohol phosphatidyltransferase family protein [Ignavibacteria bacterium]